MFRSGDAGLKGEMAKPRTGAHLSPGGTSRLGSGVGVPCTVLISLVLRDTWDNSICHRASCSGSMLAATCEGSEQNSYFLSVSQVLTVSRIAQEKHISELLLYNPVKKLHHQNICSNHDPEILQVLAPQGCWEPWGESQIHPKLLLSPESNPDVVTYTLNPIWETETEVLL